MIVDDILSADHYFDLHEGMETAFAFISDAMGNDLPDGEYEIDGRNIFASICSCEGLGREKAKLEAHRKYIDIHFCIEGREMIGWRHINGCREICGEYDKEKDIEFYSDDPISWNGLSGDVFGVFFPRDAHAPLGGEGPCRKIIVKISCAR